MKCDIWVKWIVTICFKGLVCRAVNLQRNKDPSLHHLRTCCTAVVNLLKFAFPHILPFGNPILVNFRRAISSLFRIAQIGARVVSNVFIGVRKYTIPKCTSNRTLVVIISWKMVHCGISHLGMLNEANVNATWLPVLPLIDHINLLKDTGMD